MRLWCTSLKRKATVRKSVVRMLTRAILWSKEFKTKLSDLKTQTSLRTSEMNALSFICAGSTCGAALYGNKTRKSNSSEQINSCKSFRSLRQRVCACLTPRSFTWLLIRATATVCLKWRGECTSPCAHAVFFLATPFSVASSTIRRRNRNRREQKTYLAVVITILPCISANSEPRKNAVTMTMPRIVNTCFKGRKNSCSTPLQSCAVKSATLLTSVSALSRHLLPSQESATRSIASRSDLSWKKNVANAMDSC